MSETHPGHEIDEDRLRQELRLAFVSGVGPLIRQRLVTQFGSAEQVLAAGSENLQSVSGVGSTLAKRIVSARDDVNVDEQLELARANNIQILLTSHAGYPPLLKEIHDPPSVLFVRGTLLSGDRLAVAIFGTRHARRYGL